MEIKTYAATSVDGRALNQEVIMDFSGRMAGIWHMKGTFISYGSQKKTRLEDPQVR